MESVNDDIQEHLNISELMERPNRKSTQDRKEQIKQEIRMIQDATMVYSPHFPNE